MEMERGTVQTSNMASYPSQTKGSVGLGLSEGRVNCTSSQVPVLYIGEQRTVAAVIRHIAAVEYCEPIAIFCPEMVIFTNTFLTQQAEKIFAVQEHLSQNIQLSAASHLRS